MKPPWALAWVAASPGMSKAHNSMVNFAGIFSVAILKIQTKGDCLPLFRRSVSVEDQVF